MNKYLFSENQSPIMRFQKNGKESWITNFNTIREQSTTKEYNFSTKSGSKMSSLKCYFPAKVLRKKLEQFISPSEKC